MFSDGADNELQLKSVQQNVSSLQRIRQEMKRRDLARGTLKPS